MLALERYAKLLKVVFTNKVRKSIMFCLRKNTTTIDKHLEFLTIKLN